MQTCFLQRDVFEFYQRIYPFYELLSLFTYFYEFYHHMSSPGQKRGTCGHVTALFDSHKKCARCREKGVREIPVSRKLIAKFVRRSHFVKYNNWPPLPTRQEKNVESRRNLQLNCPVMLPQLSWTLQRSLCWDG